MVTPRLVQQGYWYWPELPYIELRSTHRSQLAYKTHFHSTFSIGAIYEGSTLTNYKRLEYQLNPGDLALIEANQPHSCNPLADRYRSYHMLYIDYSWCLRMLSTLYQRPIHAFSGNQFIVNQPELFNLYQKLVNSLHNHQWITANQQLNRLMSTLFKRYCTPHLVDLTEHKVTHYVKQQWLNPSFDSPSLTELARKLTLREETIVRIFKKDTGMTPIAFLNNVRIEEAKKLIRQGHNLIDVAYQSGFSDQSHFHKAFVYHTASTPKQYQKSGSIFDKI